MRRKHKTMKQALLGAFVFPIMTISGLGMGVLVAEYVTPAAVQVEPSQPAAPSPSRVERLIERNDCWADDAPKDVIPGHAVVTLPGQDPKVAHADVGFAIWLDGRPGTVHAFCK